ncbi:MAG: NAD(+) synthase [Lachnospiraceae bacterium]|nr:NAD(+) synthase [Lachnospiraceae bacterium]
MKDGFVKVAAVTPVIRLGDCIYNADEIIRLIKEAEERRIKVVCFPELCLTGYTCGDLFLQDVLLTSARSELVRIARATAGLSVFAVVSLPLQVNSKLYICAVAMQNGRILGAVPKHFLPAYGEYYESRHFQQGAWDVKYIDIGGQSVPFGMKLLFDNTEMPELSIAVEICEDLWMPQPPSGSHVLAGATLVLNPSASDELAGKRAYRRGLVSNQSARLVCGYLYADAGEGESTTDLSFSGHNLIAENGTLLAQSELFSNGMTVSEIDINKLVNERRRMTSYASGDEGYVHVPFSFGSTETAELTRHYPKNPFIPEDEGERVAALRQIIAIQAHSLMSRLKCIGCRQAVLGLSGGLDSTLALLVTVEAFKGLGIDTHGITAVTMPCFGTSKRTYANALILAEELGVELIEINIKEAVLRHFEDIGQDPEVHDVTFENAQARERTQILMDLANKNNGIVIGTGDLSELALGFATYNGDHMSMYGVNASVPKTLVRELVRYIAVNSKSQRLCDTLLDVLDTPVSPELLPATAEGVTSQITEDIVGPYELHDFFLFYMLRYGFRPAKIYRLAKYVFDGDYDDATLLKWLKSFYRRFFAQQFKRSCLPDGPKVGSVALSPRGDWRMPSDIKATAWLKELDEL